VQEESLRRQAAELGLAEKVRFTGRVPHDQIHRYYDLIDILVYPRLSMRLTELVTPLKPLEAMAQGRLVVASDVGGHRELMTDGVTAKLFRAGDVEALSRTVLELIDDKQSWPRLREQARRYVEQERTWEASAARYQPIYSGLVEAWAKSA
jgi:glycosyltransferase involved in cell wall biosynthesis